MKKFFINGLYFFAILLIVMGVLEILLLDKPNTYSYKYKYVEKHLNDINILFLGNSHIEEAVIPELVGENAFNLAMNARYMKYDIELAKKFIPKLNHLKVVVMPLDYGSFVCGRGIENKNEQKNNNDRKMLEQSMKCMYSKYMDIHVDPFWNWSEFLNSNDNFLQRLFYDQNEGIECDSLGFIALDIKYRNKNWKNRALPSLIDESKNRDDSSYYILCSSYRILAQLAQEQGAKLILITTPLYKTYLQYESQTILDERNVFVRELQKEYSCVSYYDFSNLDILNDDDFNDASHLTKTGAIKFSKLLHSIVNQ